METGSSSLTNRYCQHILCICWTGIVTFYELHGTYIKIVSQLVVPPKLAGQWEVHVVHLTTCRVAVSLKGTRQREAAHDATERSWMPWRWKMDVSGTAGSPQRRRPRWWAVACSLALYGGSGGLISEVTTWQWHVCSWITSWLFRHVVFSIGSFAD